MNEVDVVLTYVSVWTIMICSYHSLTGSLGFGWLVGRGAGRRTDRAVIVRRVVEYPVEQVRPRLAVERRDPP